MARRATQPVGGKKISAYDMIGKRGIALIDSIVSEIGFLWHPTGLEAGIDGYIEIRDRQTGDVTNNIIQVQSKATDKEFDGETAESFDYTCDPRDLNYWLNGNAPVVLIRSRPRTNEAYWVSLKDYFSDPQRRATRKITFDKKRDRLQADIGCIQSLTNLAVPRGAGLYLSPLPKVEVLYLNLLPISRFPERMYIARTEYRSDAEFRKALRRLDRSAGNVWMLKGGNLYSFADLAEYPWHKLCDRGSLESYTVSVWAGSDDTESKNNLVELLNLLLRERLALRGVDYHETHEFYYFRDTDDLTSKKVGYRSIKRKAQRTVFEAYNPKGSAEPAHYRHSAFYGHFVRYDGTWYLEINPTYHFTSDGRRSYRFAHNSLSGLKRLEKNAAVMGQVVMWAALLQEYFPPPDLIDATVERRLQFGALPTVTIERGIPDEVWLKTEEGDEAGAIESEIEEMGLFGL